MVVYDSKVHEKNFFADEILGFTFKTANRKMALTTTSSLNEGSLALQKAYGFQEVARIPDAFSDGEDLILSKLTREDYMKRRGH
jgi:RimJ/RimL family protein N-acetyltransferase